MYDAAEYAQEAERFETATTEELLVSALHERWDCGAKGFIPGPDGSYQRAVDIRKRRLDAAGYYGWIEFLIMAGVFGFGASLEDGSKLSSEEKLFIIRQYHTRVPLEDIVFPPTRSNPWKLGSEHGASMCMWLMKAAGYDRVCTVAGPVPFERWQPYGGASGWKGRLCAGGRIQDVVPPREGAGIWRFLKVGEKYEEGSR